MKTHISEFCTEFSEALFPLSTALGDAVRTIDSIEGSPDGMSEGLANVMHRLEALVNKTGYPPGLDSRANVQRKYSPIIGI